MNYNTDYQALAHHWIYNDDYSHCYGYRMYSERDKIYSYGSHYLMGQKVDIGDERVYVLNSDTHSVTTTKQMWCLKAAIPNGRKLFQVPNAALDHVKNIAYYFEELENSAIKESKARTVDYKPEIISLINTLNNYINTFKCDKRKITKLQKQILEFNLEHNIQDLVELLTGIRNEKVRIAKKKVAKLNKVALENQKELLTKWLNFETNHAYLPLLNKTYLRFNKDRNLIETSTSASVTVEEALLLHAKIERAERLLGSKVGVFKIVEAGKLFKIGCTTLTRDIMNDMCKQLNVKEVF